MARGSARTSHERFTELVGCRWPVVQAPIGGAASPRLAAEVSNAGGLGSLALTWTDPPNIRRKLSEFRRLSDGPLNANFVLDFPVEELVAAALDAGAEVVSLFWGDPGQLCQRVLDGGAVPIVVAGTVEEARRAVDRGAQVVVAQGVEAGGHVRGRAGTVTLVPAMVDAVSPMPVLAAGGIADARGSAAARSLGAAGIWVGTRFVASVEADAHPLYKDAITRAGAGGTVLTELFDGEWPSAPARTLRNSTFRRWDAAGRPTSGAREGEGETIGWRNGRPVPRYHSDAPTWDTDGDIEAMALYAGEGAVLIREIRPASELVRMLASPWLVEAVVKPG